jgi:hypothetical protein
MVTVPIRMVSMLTMTEVPVPPVDGIIEGSTCSKTCGVDGSYKRQQQDPCVWIGQEQQELALEV